MGLVAPVPAHNVCDGSVEELCASVVFFFVGFGQAGEREPSGASDNSWGGGGVISSMQGAHCLL